MSIPNNEGPILAPEGPSDLGAGQWAYAPTRKAKSFAKWRNPIGITGAIIVGFNVFIAIFGPYIWTIDPDELVAMRLEDPIENLSQFILPAISISVFTLAIVMRMVRATMLEVLGQDYVRTARAKGVKRKVVISRHALRNAMIPVVTVVGFEIGILMGGSAIVEIIFGLPGIGNTLINAIFNRDYPVVQGATMLLAFIFIFANLAVDLLYGVLDPRISQE